MNTLFQKPIEHLRGEISAIHTGRANPALLENIQVNAYESQMRLQEVASVSVPEAQQLLVQPWDAGLVQAIETALRESELRLSPVVDGQSIRLNFPPLTEEKRQEYVKVVHGKLEDARIGVRKVREEMLKELKDQEKAGDISEDEYFRMEKEVQDDVDEANERIKQIGEKKEQELMTV